MSTRIGRVALSLLLMGLLGACKGADAPAAPVGIELGDQAPPLEGTLPGGERFELAGADAPRTVLIFYRGGYCGLCRERLRLLQEHLPGYEGMGVRVVAVTSDPPSVTAETRQATGAEFPIVSVDSATLQRWDLFDSQHQAPKSGTVIVDSTGIIRFRHVGQSPADQVSDAALVAKLEQED